MKIVDLTPEQENLYFQCLEEWSDEIKEAGDHKACWYRMMKEKGLRVKLAQDDAGTVGGMIQYVPIEHSFSQGEGLYFVHCIWVHGHKKGRGNFQKKGMGSALLKAAEEDARSLGAKGMAVWGITLPFFMRASWFKKHGYKKADKMDMQVLLWKPFSDEACPPSWIRQRKSPETTPGRVTVTIVRNGWCPGQNTAFERAKRAAAEFGDRVVVREYDTSAREVFLEWGTSDALYVDNKQVRCGPPPSYKKIHKAIARKVKKIA